MKLLKEFTDKRVYFLVKLYPYNVTKKLSQKTVLYVFTYF